MNREKVKSGVHCTAVLVFITRRLKKSPTVAYLLSRGAEDRYQTKKQG